MGRICQATGYVVDPYRDFPNLLEDLRRLLKSETSQNIRVEVVKVSCLVVQELQGPGHLRSN